MTNKIQNLKSIKEFIKLNADPIQKEATRLHKEYLGVKYLRSEKISKYQENHVNILRKIAENLDGKNFKKSNDEFQNLGSKFAIQSVADGLTLEEAVDGTIFLKQALWKMINNEKLLNKLSTQEFYDISQTVGTYIDVLTSRLAFTYHNELKNVENNLRFLSDAGKILSSSLDYRKTLDSIAFLAVPGIADWCSVDILDDNGVVQLVAIAHKEPRQVKWAKDFRKTQPIDLKAPTGIANVLRTGRSEIYPVITMEMLKAVAKSKKELDLARKLKLYSAMIVPISSQKKVIGAISFVITDSKRSYNQSDLLMAEELAKRASLAIENAILYKGSQDAITLRDEFISVASHELKTPVTSVKMFTQVLKKHSEQISDEKAVIYLSKMDSQVNKLTELIYDLLNVSKIQAGRIEFKMTEFNFDNLVKEIIDILQHSVDRHKLRIEGKTNKIIYGDQERIGQVINNLISNAIKYSPKEKEVIIKLMTKNGKVQLSVRDYGIGISKKHMGRIFERFYRAYDGNDKTYPGLGIGLYISSEIIKRHKGKLWVESGLGKGSEFTFSLPIDHKKIS